MSRWYAGRWRTEEGIRRHQAARNLRNARRVGTRATNYLGMAPRPEQAAYLNALRREFRDRQNTSRA